ncbi:carbohydrate sulfotransferase 11-like [Clavelina lepadiformis]|uniref:carbohydrate sulfotransferase 11-like n=1 Tax=Clavelina lepadiformis TaxID=159417 RepID=UPI0040417E33
MQFSGKRFTIPYRISLFLLKELICWRYNYNMSHYRHAKKYVLLFLTLMILLIIWFHKYQKAVGYNFLYFEKITQNCNHGVARGLVDESHKVENLRSEEIHILTNEGSQSDENFGRESSDEDEDEFMKRMKKRMDARRKHLQRACKDLGLRDEHSVDNLRGRITHFKKYDLVNCFNPKTGITNFKALLHAIVTSDKPTMEDYVLGKQSGQQLREFIDNYTIINKTEQTSLLSNQDKLKMIVVREPLERLLSSFRDRFVLRSLPGYRRRSEEIHKKYGSNPNVSDDGLATFNEFVSYFIDTPSGTYNTHWQHYRNLCQPCAIDFDIIAKQETIEEDTRYLLKLIGAPKEAKIPAGYKTRGTSQIVLDYYKSVQPKEKRFELYRQCSQEFALFDYSKPSYLSLK